MANRQRKPGFAGVSLFMGRAGFTLIELLAVMAVVAILAAIVTTSVSGIGGKSQDATAKRSAETTNTAAGEYFADQRVPDDVTTHVVLTTKLNGEDPSAEGVVQTISIAWPEVPITTAYPVEFDTVESPPVENVVITLSDGVTVLSEAGLLEGYTAVDFTVLEVGGYLEKLPRSLSLVRTVGLSGGDVSVHDYLWLFKKTTSSSGSSNDSRSVAVFNLDEVAGVGDSLELKYKQLF